MAEASTVKFVGLPGKIWSGSKPGPKALTLEGSTLGLPSFVVTGTPKGEPKIIVNYDSTFLHFDSIHLHLKYRQKESYLECGHHQT